MTDVQDQEDDLYLLDPRQKRMWRFYTDPESDTFSIAYRSALKAGYSESYSGTISQRPWFLAYKRRFNLLQKAEKALDKTLDMDTADSEGAEQADLLRVQVDAAKFVAKTLGKDEGYSERTEVTGKDGNGIVFMPVELMDKYNLQTSAGEEVKNGS